MLLALFILAILAASICQLRADIMIGQPAHQRRSMISGGAWLLAAVIGLKLAGLF